jgi:two-component system, response regulator / RNA-binding antiterminator
MTARIPNFRGQRVLVLHRLDRNCEAIVEQLERLGAVVSVQWPAERVSADGVDVVFFDSDLGFDELFEWEPGRSALPLVAILGSEAPGRIEWTLAQEPSAYLMKPVGSTGVFSALSIALHNFALRRSREDALRRMEEQLQLRGTVLRAAIILMKRCAADDGEALRLLRAEAMRRRTTLEAVSALVLSGHWIGPNPKLPKSLPRHAGK